MFFWKKRTSCRLKLIHVEPSMNGIFCFGHEGLECLTEEDSRELLQAVQAITQETIAYDTPWEWTLMAMPALKTFPLKKAMHQELRPFLPSGKDAARWNRWMTEVQMVLHAHPVNQQREALGKKTVNWMWIDCKK
jgi:hypothetical protein